LKAESLLTRFLTFHKGGRGEEVACHLRLGGETLHRGDQELVSKCEKKNGGKSKRISFVTVSGVGEETVERKKEKSLSSLGSNIGYTEETRGSKQF